MLTKTVRRNDSKPDKKKRRSPSLYVPAAVVSWLKGSFVADPDGSVGKDAIYQDYVTFCQQHNIQPKQNNIFGKVLKRLFPSIRPRRHGPAGNMTAYYAGISVYPGAGLISRMIPSSPSEDAATSHLLKHCRPVGLPDNSILKQSDLAHLASPSSSPSASLSSSSSSSDHKVLAASLQEETIVTRVGTGLDIEILRALDNNTSNGNNNVSGGDKDSQALHLPPAVASLVSETSMDANGNSHTTTITTTSTTTVPCCSCCCFNTLGAMHNPWISDRPHSHHIQQPQQPQLLDQKALPYTLTGRCSRGMQPVYSRSYRSTTGHNHHSPKDSNNILTNNNNCNSLKRKERENAKTPRRKSESSINTNANNKKCGARAAKRRKNNSETPEALLIASQTIQATIAAGFPPLSTSLPSSSASLPAQPFSSPASLNSSNYYYSALGLQLSMQDLSRFMHVFCTQYWPLAPLPGSLIGESSLRYAMSPSGQEEKGIVTLSINFALCIGALYGGNFEAAKHFFVKARGIIEYIIDCLDLNFAIILRHLAQTVFYFYSKMEAYPVAVCYISAAMATCEAINLQSTDVYEQCREYESWLCKGELQTQQYKRPLRPLGEANEVQQPQQQAQQAQQGGNNRQHELLQQGFSCRKLMNEVLRTISNTMSALYMLSVSLDDHADSLKQLEEDVTLLSTQLDGHLTQILQAEKLGLLTPELSLRVTYWLTCIKAQIHFVAGKEEASYQLASSSMKMLEDWLETPQLQHQQQHSPSTTPASTLNTTTSHTLVGWDHFFDVIAHVFQHSTTTAKKEGETKLALFLALLARHNHSTSGHPSCLLNVSQFLESFPIS